MTPSPASPAVDGLLQAGMAHQRAGQLAEAEAAHVHPTGWASGVYYVQLPDDLGAAPGDRAGWIEFGRPPADLPLRQPPRIVATRPHEGLLLLFPSYAFHRTFPFAGSRQRISIAFDVIR